MRVVLWVVLAVGGVLVALPAASHHSFAAEFDITRPVTVTGIVKRIEWTNPHAWFYLDVTASDGKTSPWAIEVLSANGLMRRGWTRDTVKVGDRITIEGFGARDGTDTANAAAVIMADTGERLYESSAEGQDLRR